MDDKLTIYYQNCGGFRTKLNTLYFNILSNNYDIIVLTETWLVPHISDNEFIDQRYTVFRCDRDRVLTGKKDGGGVLIAVLRNLQPSVIISSLSPNISECLIVQLPSSTPKKYNLICVSYIPPKTPEVAYNMLLDKLELELGRLDFDSIILIGDFNLPSLKWSVNNTHMECLTSGGPSPGRHLVDLLSRMNIKQYNSIFNSTGGILDLALSNTECEVYKPNIPLLPEGKFHPSFYLIVKFNAPSPPLKQSNSLTKFNFYKANYDKLNSSILEMSWSSLLNHLSAEEALNVFYEKVFEIIKLNVPLCSSKTRNFPVWFSKSLIHIHKNKSRYWLKWKKYSNISDYEIFSLYRKRFKNECEKCFNKYIISVEDSIQLDANKFWSYVSNRKHKSGIPSQVKLNNKVVNDPVSICNMFSSFFKSVYEPSSLDTSSWQPPSVLSDSDVHLSDIHLSLQKIQYELKYLDANKGPGPDGLPAIFLKNTSGSVCTPLYIIYNKCLREGTCPALWKMSNIVPVHKSGSRSEVDKYRPISIMSVLSKLLERLIHSVIYPALHKIILPEQHGFVKKRSTTTNLMLFTSFIFESIDNREQVDAVYTDFQKAFDKVDHVLLLNKLAYNGIRGNLLRWFCSYISNRSQRVVVNGFASNSVRVTSGVPQGSILGPLLFVIFINDIKKCFLNTKFLLYADDLKIYKTIHSIADCNLFQDDLDRFSNYCITNKLHLSLSKCNTIIFTKNKNITRFTYTLCEAPLREVTTVRDLGVTLDSKFKLDQHIEQIVSKAFQMYGFVMRAAVDFKRPSTYLHLYKTIIRPQLEYAVPIWNPYFKKYINNVTAPVMDMDPVMDTYKLILSKIRVCIVLRKLQHLSFKA